MKMISIFLVILTSAHGLSYDIGSKQGGGVRIEFLNKKQEIAQIPDLAYGVRLTLEDRFKAERKIFGRDLSFCELNEYIAKIEDRSMWDWSGRALPIIPGVGAGGWMMFFGVLGNSINVAAGGAVLAVAGIGWAGWNVYDGIQDKKYVAYWLSNNTIYDNDYTVDIPADHVASNIERALGDLPKVAADRNTFKNCRLGMALEKPQPAQPFFRIR